MTRIRQQFNPSTLKAAYNPITEKAITMDLDGSSCVYCVAGQTPKRIKVILSNLVTCVDCQADPQPNSWIFSGSAEAINDIEFTLTQSPFVACLWIADIDGDWGSAVEYSDVLCENFLANHDTTRLIFEVRKQSANDIYIDVHTFADGPYGVFRYDTAAPGAKLTKCITVDAVANKYICANIGHGISACESGTATIIEI